MSSDFRARKDPFGEAAAERDLRIELQIIRRDEELRELREQAEQHIRSPWPLGNLAQGVIQLLDRLQDVEGRLAGYRSALEAERARRRAGRL